MVSIELNPKLKRPIAIGVGIFVTEFVFGLTNIISGYIPMIFVMALVIGYLTTSIEDGVFALIIALVIGNIIGGLLMAVVLYPSWLGPGNIDLVALALLFFITPFIAMSGSISVLNGFALDETFLWVFLLGPALYFFSPGFAAIGAKIGELRRNEPEDDTSELQNSGFPKKIDPEVSEEHEIIIDTNSTN